MADSITCDSCERELSPFGGQLCSQCACAALEESAAEPCDCDIQSPSASEEIRRWANWRFAKGQIGPGLRDELEQCADDIEATNG